MTEDLPHVCSDSHGSVETDPVDQRLEQPILGGKRFRRLLLIPSPDNGDVAGGVRPAEGGALL